MATLGIKISDGPSKMDMMMSLFRAGSSQLVVVFKTVLGSFTIMVDGMERNDGSGESWDIKGYLLCYPTSEYEGLVRACYSTANRAGVLTLILISEK